MRVYFTCSIRGVDILRENYRRIHELIAELGYVRIGNDGLCGKEHLVYERYGFDMRKHNEETMEKIRQSDVVVLEVSVHSLSMGYVTHTALSMGKPIVALHIAGMRPAFLEGLADERLQLLEYSKDTIRSVLSQALHMVEDLTETRFTMLVGGKVRAHLDSVSSEGVSKSEYIRNLILKDMGEK